MNKQEKENALLKAMSDEETLDTLYDIWSLLQRCPSKAVDILMQFKDVTQAVNTATLEIQQSLHRFNSMKNEMETLKHMASHVSEFNRVISGTDENLVLNRMARIVSLSEQVTKLKQSGGLDIIERLMK